MTARFAARNPAFDVTPAELDHRDRDRARRPLGAVTRVARRRRRRRMKAIAARRRLRDPARPADRRPAEAAAARRRAADARLDPRPRRARSTRSTRCTSSRTRASSRLASSAGRRRSRRGRPRRRHALERRPARRDRGHPLRDRARPGSATTTCSCVAGDNLFEFSLADSSRSGATKGTASAVALYDCGDRELARQYGDRRDRRRRRASSTSSRSRQLRRRRSRPRRPTCSHRDARAPRRRVPRRRATRRTRRELRRLARDAGAGLRLHVRGRVVRHRRPRPAPRRRQPLARSGSACRCATSTRSSRHRVDTELTQTRHGFARTVDEVARRPAPAPALRRLWAAWLARSATPVDARSSGSSPPLCDRCGAPTAWPVDRCRECSGRRLAFASARSAVAYTGAARPLVRGWKERGLRPFGALAAELVAEVVPRPAADVITYIPPDGDRSAKRGHHPARRLRRELGGLWALDAGPLLRRARPDRAADRPAPGRAAPERARRVRRRRRAPPRTRGPRRRRVHDGRDGRRGRQRAAGGRRARPSTS